MGPSSPSPYGHNPEFSANVCCDQRAGYTKMSPGMEVGRGPVFDVDPAPPSSLRENRAQPATNFWPLSVVAKRLDG